MILKKNHSLCGKSFSLPIVTSGLTHGLSICGYLFCDPGTRIIIPYPFWTNYELIFSHAYQTTFDTFPFFNASDGFNIAMLREKLLSDKPGKRIVCLNFPNNPTGYTPSESEAKAIAEVFLQAATKGCKIIVIIDDAYFGLVFKHGIYTESIFSKLCNLHPNLLAVKLDGATKEDYAWGVRIGFITYGIADSKPNLLNALESKTGAAVRGTISNASNIAQALLIKAYSSDTYEKEKRTKFAVLQKRYKKVNKILAAHPEYKQEFIPLPFNSGYFMCIKLLHADSEKVRQKLLADYSIGVIATGNLIRLAFSSTPTNQLDRLFDGIYKAAVSLKRNRNTSANDFN